jgi:hypothetical protein
MPWPSISIEGIPPHPDVDPHHLGALVLDRDRDRRTEVGGIWRQEHVA